MVDTTPLSLLSLMDDTLALAVTPDGVMSESITRANTFWMRAGMTVDISSLHSRKKIFETLASLTVRQMNGMAYRVVYPNSMPAPEINRLIADLSNCYVTDVQEYDTQLLRQENSITVSGRDIAINGNWSHMGRFPIIPAAEMATARGRISKNTYFASVAGEAVNLRIPDGIEYGFVRFVVATRFYRLEQAGTITILNSAPIDVQVEGSDVHVGRWIPFRAGENFEIRSDGEQSCAIIEFCGLIGKSDGSDVLALVSPVDLANVARVFQTGDQVSPLGFFFHCVADDGANLLVRIRHDPVLAFWIYSYLSRLGSIANALRVDRNEDR